MAVLADAAAYARPVVEAGGIKQYVQLCIKAWWRRGEVGKILWRFDNQPASTTQYSTPFPLMAWSMPVRRHRGGAVKLLARRWITAEDYFGPKFQLDW